MEYPLTREELAWAAAEAGHEAAVINLLKALPEKTYLGPTDVLRELAEAVARFGMGTSDVRHRGDLGRDAVETGSNPTRHP